MSLGRSAQSLPEVQEIVDEKPTDNIRTLVVDEDDYTEPLRYREKGSPWKLDNSANRAKQSAAAYLFARRLHEELGVPIGIIEGAWGGKPTPKSLEAARGVSFFGSVGMVTEFSRYYERFPETYEQIIPIVAETPGKNGTYWTTASICR